MDVPDNIRKQRQRLALDMIIINAKDMKKRAGNLTASADGTMLTELLEEFTKTLAN